MDTQWYFDPTPSVTVINPPISSNAFVTWPTLSNYAPLSTVATLSNALVYELGVGTSNSSNVVSCLAQLATIKQELHDALIDTIATDVAGDGLNTFADALEWYLNNKNNVQNALRDLISKTLGNATDGSDFAGDGNNAPTNGRKLVDYRFLSNAPLACDRNDWGISYGLAVAGKDLSFTPSTRICAVPDSDLYNGVYGLMWGTSMASSHKKTILDFATQTLTLSNITAPAINSQFLVSSNAIGQNLGFSVGTVSALTASTLDCGTATTVSRWTSNEYTSNAFVKSAAVSNCAVSSGLSCGYFASYGSNCTIDASGNLASFSVAVNGNSLYVSPTGDVYNNGTRVITGGKCVVYDDQIVSRSDRGTVNAVLSGNIGTDDTSLFDSINAAPSYVRDAPGSFSDLAGQNRRDVLNTFINPTALPFGYDASSWWSV